MIEFLKNRSSYPDELEVWQVAIILNCSRPYVYRLLKEQKIAHYHIGRSYRIDTDDLVRFLEESVVHPKTHTERR